MLHGYANILKKIVYVFSSYLLVSPQNPININLGRDDKKSPSSFQEQLFYQCQERKLYICWLFRGLSTEMAQLGYRKVTAVMVCRRKISPYYYRAIAIIDILRMELHGVLAQSQFCMCVLNIIIYLRFQLHLLMENKEGEVFWTQQNEE